MRVLVDTNIIISALLFPRSTPAAALEVVLQEHRLVLTEWVLSELREVVGRKRPDLLVALGIFLEFIDFELAQPGEPSVPISDPDDQPIIDAAVAGAVDAIVTGDQLHQDYRLAVMSPSTAASRSSASGSCSATTGTNTPCRIAFPVSIPLMNSRTIAITPCAAIMIASYTDL